MKKGSNRFLRAAAQARRHQCGSLVMECLFEAAVHNGDYEAAHEIGVRYGSLISDELIRKLAMAVLLVGHHK